MAGLQGEKPGSLSADALFIVGEIASLRNERNNELKQFSDSMTYIRNDVHEIKNNIEKISNLQLEHQKELTKLQTITGNLEGRVKEDGERLTKAKDILYSNIRALEEKAHADDEKVKDEIWQEMRLCQSNSSEKNKGIKEDLKSYTQQLVDSAIKTIKLWVYGGIITAAFALILHFLRSLTGAK